MTLLLLPLRAGYHWVHYTLDLYQIVLHEHPWSRGPRLHPSGHRGGAGGQCH